MFVHSKKEWTTSITTTFRCLDYIADIFENKDHLCWRHTYLVYSLLTANLADWFDWFDEGLRYTDKCEGLLRIICIVVAFTCGGESWNGKIWFTVTVTRFWWDIL